MKLYKLGCLFGLVISILITFHHSHSAEYNGTFRYGPIPLEYLGKVLTEEPVLIKLSAGENITLEGLSLHSSRNSIFISGISADYIYVAVIDGEVISNDISAIAGEAIFSRPNSLAIKSYYDARKTLDSLQGSLPIDVFEALEKVAKKQRRKVFWGIYRSAGINLQASTPTGIELQRRTYLNNPSIAEIRFSENDLETKALLVAEAFATALETRDLSKTTVLLHPGIFMNPNEYGVSDKALARRHDYALHLINSTKLKNHKHFNAQLSGDKWHITGLLSFSIKIADGFPFVDTTSIKFAE